MGRGKSGVRDENARGAFVEISGLAGRWTESLETVVVLLITQRS
jgi:hypothetical protein